jgi:hypothetical protein
LFFSIDVLLAIATILHYHSAVAMHSPKVASFPDLYSDTIRQSR